MSEKIAAEKITDNVKIESLPQARVKISGDVKAEKFDRNRRIALEEIRISVEVPGFRAGKAPEAVVIKHVGEMKILERAAEAAIDQAYGEILDEHKIRAIGMPQISITKIAAGNPLGFIIETAVMPEISFTNYKTLAKEAAEKIPEPETEVKESEVQSVIDDVLKKTTPENESSTEPAAKAELTDEFVKKFGDFKDVADFKSKIKENLLEQKKQNAKDKKRGAIADRLIDEAKFDVPELIVESELNTMVNQFRSDIERSGLTFDAYLSQIKKKESDIRNDWRENALRRAKLELVLKHIARTEKIALDEEVVKKEVEHILSHVKGADRFRVRMYVENLMTNQKVFDFLEN